MNVDISKITSFEDLRKAYTQIEKEEDGLKEEINQLYTRKDSLSEEMVKLEALFPNLELLESNSNTLSKMIIFAADLADSVSVKVRQLDLAKNRVHMCIRRVEDILDLKACTVGVEKALSEEDFENAAGYIKRFLDMDENMLRVTEEEAENSLKILHQSEATLKAIVCQKFDAAVHDDDFKTIERFFKIFPLLNQQTLGLEKFGNYLTVKINREMTGQIKVADVSDPQRYAVKFVDLMTTLMETIAQCVKDYDQPFIQKHYGHGFLLIALRIIQKECDTWAVTILDKFKSERQFGSKLSKVKLAMSNSYSYGQMQQQTIDKPEAMDLESLISEIALINTRVELYLRFLRRNIQSDFDKAPDKKSEAEVSEICSKFFSQTKIVNEMQELINNYILLEEYFLKEMITKAMNNTEIEDKVNVLKIVDSVFFVVNKCIRRTLSSGNVEGVCAMLNLASTILIEQYATNTLQSRLKQNSISSSSAWMRDAAYSYMHGSSMGLSTMASSTNLNAAAGTSTAVGGSSRKQLFILYVNSTEASIDCVQTLKTSLEKEIESVFQKSGVSSTSKLHECLTAMASSVSDKLREISDVAIKELSLSLIKPQIKNYLTNFSAAKQILTEEEFVLLEANDPWVEMFIINVQSMLSEFQESMVSGVYEKVIQKICEETSIRIEKIVKDKAFNRLGGIQFDREVRTLINFFATTTKWGVREKFIRLRQIASILNLENVNEISSYWETMTWRLVPQEVRTTMALRTDFRTEDIRKLKLV